MTLWCHCCGRPAFGPDELVSDGDPVPCGCPCDSETPAYIAGAEDPCPVCEREAIRDVWVDGPDCEAARAARERALVLAYHDELAASRAREVALRDELERAHRDLDVDRELFFRLVRESMEALHLEDADIAGKMPASRSAISRWRRGLNAPLPMARGNVLKFFMKRVRRALRQQEQAREDGEKWVGAGLAPLEVDECDVAELEHDLNEALRGCEGPPGDDGDDIPF